MSGSGMEHTISVRSVQEWLGEFDSGELDKDGELSENAEMLQFNVEISLSFECSCGSRFRKFETAADHLRSLHTDTDDPESGDTQ